MIKVKLPPTHTAKIFVHYGVGEYNLGEIKLSGDSFTNDGASWGTIIIGNAEITLDLEVEEVDQRQERLIKWKLVQKETLADHHNKEKNIAEEIQKLQSIEYQPREDFDEIPKSTGEA